MANVSVAVTIRNRRWGENGENWGTPQDVAPGARILTVYLYPKPRTLSATTNIPPEGIDIEVAVD